ncbi:MAG: hypothetical protein DMG62_05735 [Acidobacteria bacterium]|nr:MAG: hypothetical protein DMG62_05735 [Acidobacteriota bacterium]
MNHPMKSIVMLILRSKSFFRLLLSLGILLLGAKSTLAQDYVNGTGAPTFTTSLPVELGFVNVSNGNLHLEIPIASPPQRGNIVLGEKLVYDSRMWMPVDNGTSQVWQPMNSNSGWRFVHVRKSGTVTYDANVYNCTNGQSGTYTDYTNFVWTSPDGTKIPFPVETKSGCSADVSSNDAFASDASGYHMWVSNFTQAYVINTTGNQLYDVPRDNNGNYVTQKGNGDAIDTLNRVPVTTTVVGNQTFLDVLSSQNTTNRYTLNYSNITVNTAFSQSGVTEYSGSIQVLSSVQLPNGTSYQFTYDSYGELATVTLPTGGLLSYGYTNFVDSYGQKNRWISSRTTVGGTWSYTPSVISSCSGGSQNCQQKVVVTKPSNDSIQYTFTLNGGAWNSQAVYYDHSGAQLATVTNDYDLSKTCTGCNGAAYVTKSRHTTSLNSSTGTVTKKTEYSYNATWNTLVTAVKDWNLYTGTPGTTPDRETDITYVSDDAHLSKNMLNLPTSVTVKNGAGTQLAQTLYTYDRYDLTGLSDVPGVVQHDSAFDISRSTRGNVTTVQKWVAGSTYLTWKYWYDITGHVTKSADSAGNITTYSYADNFYTDTGANPPPGYAPSGVTNAYPTTTTLPIIGAQTAGYYFGNGGAAFSTDQNGATSYSHYLDPLNRRTITTDSAGGWVDTSYTSATQTDTYTGINDATPSTACTSCRHDQTIFDGVARKIRSSLVSDPEGTTSTDTSYDVNGRAGAVSNPYRSTTESTYGTTTSIYDGLDRVTQIIRPDNNAVNVSYGAAAGSVSQLCSIGTYGIGYPVLSSDEAGKKRLTWYSGFGKIIEVDEPNSSGILNVATCYKYDGLNNLKAIAQQAQSRTYVYDGLSRVTSSIIPESGTTTFSYVSGSSLCSGNPSNPCSQTDARGITTTYAYDSLNRIKQKSYSDGTPTVTYEYDQGSLWTVPLSNTKGRLSHVAVAGNRSERIFSYDTVGRIVRQTECLPSNCGIAAFTTTLTYSPGGNLVTINYPSTRQITYAYTNAGRVSSVTQTSIHGSGQNYSYASGLTYAPTGAAKGLPLNGGSGLSETYNYNNRLQMISQQLGTASTTFMSHSLSYLDASGNNDGNVMSVADNLSSARTQSFTYDPLNRLATANETNWGLGYVYDVYGNLLQQNVTAGTAPGLSVLVNTKNQIADSGFSYDAAGNLTSDGMNTYAYNAANQLTSVNAGVGTYTYDYGNVRVRKDTGSTYTEYIRVGGNVIAENDPAKGWSDYIFLGNRRLARADDYWQNLRIYGTANSSGQYAFFYWGNPGALNNYTIRSGDKLYLWQYQFTGAKGGMILSFGDGTSSGWTVKDQDGYYLNDDQTQAHGSSCTGKSL